MCTGMGGFIPRSFSLKICYSTDSYVKDQLKKSSPFPFNPSLPLASNLCFIPSDPSTHLITTVRKPISSASSTSTMVTRQQINKALYCAEARWNDGGGATWCPAVTSSRRIDASQICSRGQPFRPNLWASLITSIQPTPTVDSFTVTDPVAVIGADQAIYHM